MPVAEGIEVDPWSALLWLTGAGTLDNRPDGHAAYPYAADLIGEGRLVVEMAAKLRRRERFMAATEEEAQRRQDELHRNYLETMQRALERIEEMGATVPRVGPHVLQRAAELGVTLPGQDGED